MKKITIITAMALAGAVAFTGCDSNKEPGKVYMPDMGYSRAYESYAQRDTAFTMDAAKRGGAIFFNNLPPAGTIKRGEWAPYVMVKDTIGLYLKSASIANPFVDSLPKAKLAEAGRLFNINCAICHGATGAANGPIADKIGGVANLTDATRVGLADGTIFHVMTYGKGVMGSYASQLTREQRWMIVKYIRTLQPKAAPAAAAGATATKAAADTVKKG